MARVGYRVAWVLTGVVALLLVSVAVLLYLENWQFPKWAPPPPAVVKACVWIAHADGSKNKCDKQCPPPYPGGPPYTDEGHVSAGFDGKTYLYCCPKGYKLRPVTGPSGECERM
jgi:hypothetical protein